MANTLSDKLSTWRSTNQSNLLAKLKVGDALYHIKDPAVEALATEIETRLQGVENKTIRSSALAKSVEAGKFATKVEQATDGQITVEYSNFTGNSDSAVTDQWVTSVAQGTDGEITVTRSTIDGSQVALSTPVLTKTDVAQALAALVTANSNLLGTSANTYNDNTIYGARAYAKHLVDQILGEDSASSQLETLKAVIAELKDASAEGGIASTVLDTFTTKLAGMTYTDDGQTVNATSVADYVTHKIAEVNAANTQGIADLDATVGSTTVAQDKHVAVQVVETDGVLTGLTVTESDIASATALQTLDGAAVKSVNGLNPTSGAVTLTGESINVSTTDTTKLNVYLSGLSKNKADKSQFSSQSINNWATNYASETLTFTNTPTTVTIPASV